VNASEGFLDSPKKKDVIVIFESGSDRGGVYFATTFRLLW